MFNQVMMLGGGKKIKSVIRGEGGVDTLSMSALLVLFFILKVLVVQWSYNKVAPKLISNMGNSTQQFKPLTFEESLLFTLLISFLF
jgi:hypothetical protein